MKKILKALVGLVVLVAIAAGLFLYWPLFERAPPEPDNAEPVDVVLIGAGVMSVTGEPDGAPVKAGVPIADFASGLYAAYAISAMLSRVRAGGPGGWIDVPMVGATIAISALQTSEYFGTGQNPRKLGSAHPRNAPYQAYQASDGWFAIAALRAVCAAWR